MEHALIKKGHHCGMEALVAIGFWSSNIIFDLSCMKFSLSNTTAVIKFFKMQLSGTHSSRYGGPDFMNKAKNMVAYLNIKRK